MNMLIQSVITKTRHALHASFLFVIVLISLLLTGCFEKKQELQLSGNTMGTTYHVTMVAEKSLSLDLTQLQQQVDASLHHINQLMSTYVADSELSRFNQSNSVEWFDVSPETLKVIDYSLQLSQQTQGKFDVTVSPLINLWGFGEQGPTDFPNDEEIEEAKTTVGWQKLILDVANLRIKKSHPLLTVNLSAVAKGYGVDVIATLLENNGVQNYLVEIGGEIRVKGKNKSDNWWKIGVEKPSLMQSTTQAIISLQDKAIATSGDYRNFFEKDGIRYSHTIDPNTGKPVRHNIASLTVIADSAMEADGLATAFMVLGEEKALAMALEYNIPVYILLYNGEEFTSVHSDSFTPYL